MHVPNSVPAPVAHSGASTPRRIIGLDALRAIAMLLGIVLHAAAGYMTVSPDGSLWPVRDSSSSVACDVLYFWIHAFRLPIFFVLAGYFAELLATVRGPDAFMRHRVERLLWPYLLSLVTIGPLTLGAAVWGWHVSGICTWSALIDPATPLPKELTALGFGPGHLWFLQDLILLSVGFWLLRRNFEPCQGVGKPSMVGYAWWHPLACALPAVLLLGWNPDLIVSFHNSFLPVSSRLLYFGMFFAFGVLFYRCGEHFERAVSCCRYRLLAGLALSFPMILATLSYYAQPDHAMAIVMVFCTAGVAWLFIFGWFGVFLRDWSANEHLTRYLSDSSYWVYLVHLPIVIVLQILLRPTFFPPVLKVVLITLVTFSVSMATYAGLVRHTWIGRLLHGPRHPKSDYPQ